MPILTEDDVILYCPDVTITGDELTAAIRQVEFAIQSPEGANRSLEIKNYVEIKTLKQAYQSVLLSYFPIVVTEETPFTVYIRGNIQTEFNRNTNSVQWIEIDSQFCQLEANNQLYLDVNIPVSRRTRKEKAIQVKVEYTAGWDFSDTSSEDVMTIKALTAKCLSYSQSLLSNDVKNQSVVGEYSITYGNSQISSFGIPKSYLQAFKKYAPRRGVGG